MSLGLMGQMRSTKLTAARLAAAYRLTGWNVAAHPIAEFGGPDEDNACYLALPAIGRFCVIGMGVYHEQTGHFSPYDPVDIECGVLPNDVVERFPGAVALAKPFAA